MPALKDWEDWELRFWEAPGQVARGLWGPRTLFGRVWLGGLGACEVLIGAGGRGKPSACASQKPPHPAKKKWLTLWGYTIYSSAIGEVQYGQPPMRFPGWVNTACELTCAGQGGQAFPSPFHNTSRMSFLSLLAAFPELLAPKLSQ